MKPSNAPFRVREWIPFTNFALLDEMPKKVKARDHLFPYEGAKADSSLIWGLYGTASINQGLFLAEHFAGEHKKLLLTVNMWYYVPNFEQARNHISESVAEEIGYLHIGRVTSDFRASLLEQARDWVRQRVSGPAKTNVSTMDLTEVLVRYPGFVRHLLKEGSPYNLIVHPVQQSFDLDNSNTLWVATGRNDPNFVKSAEVRFMPDIEVTV